MNNGYIMQVDPKGKGIESNMTPATSAENESRWPWLLILIFVGFILLIKKYWPNICAALSEAKKAYDVGRNDEPAAPPKNSKVIFPESTPPAKQRGGLKLDDVPDHGIDLSLPLVDALDRLGQIQVRQRLEGKPTLFFLVW